MWPARLSHMLASDLDMPAVLHLEDIGEVPFDVHLELGHDRVAGVAPEVVVLVDSMADRPVGAQMRVVLPGGLPLASMTGGLVNSNRPKNRAQRPR